MIDQDMAPAETTKTEPVKESFFTRLFNSDFKIDFIGQRRRWYILSAIIVAIAITSIFVRGLNLGIEFKGGSVFTANIATANESDIGRFTEAVAKTNLPELNGTLATVVGTQTIRVQTRSLKADEISVVRQAVATEGHVDSNEVAYQLIGPSWGKQITEKGVQALVIFLVLVGLMIGLYFRNWKMSAAALLALAHDLIVTVGIYALVGFSFTPATLIGVLTILGYSLYDTVVVFDKVRENSHEITRQSQTYSQAANLAVNQMLVRSINTTIIGVLPVLAILLAGTLVLNGQGPLADLGLVMFVGMTVGAYSSIFLATPLLAQLKEREPAMRKHRASLVRRETRAATKVAASVAEISAPITAANVNISAVSIARSQPSKEIHLDLSSSSGRPQPKKEPRSTRKPRS